MRRVLGLLVVGAVLVGGGRGQDVTGGAAGVSETGRFVARAAKAHGAFGKRAAEYLVAGMSAEDRAELSAEFLWENLDLAIRARVEFPWCRELDEKLFFDAVLPYACLDEPRERWRAAMLERVRPLVVGCETAREAAQALNRGLFDLVEVHYSRERARANQAPSESIRQGKASCTGLSILLVDACRAVGVPARVAGISEWVDVHGNHTWVEVWDGRWWFTGADEFDAKGLDRAWLIGRAGKAIPGHPRHAIRAATWRPTGNCFPLPWDTASRDVHAVDVTERYLAAAGTRPEHEGRTLAVRLVDGTSGRRRTADVRWLGSDGTEIASGRTKAGRHDWNDLLRLEGPEDASGHLVVTHEGATRRFPVPSAGERAEVIELVWAKGRAAANEGKEAGRTSDTDGTAASPRRSPETTSETRSADGRPDQTSEPESTAAPSGGGAPPEPHREHEATKGVSGHEVEGSAPSVRPPEGTVSSRQKATQTQQSGLSRKEAEVALSQAWKKLVAERQAQLEEELEAGVVRAADKSMRFLAKRFGEEPESGHALWISLHGGGGAPARVNDQQWRNQIRLYEPEEGYYVAPRAPSDTWNLWHQAHVDALIARLIEAFVIVKGVDPDRVYLLGYSAGGDGVFQLAPRMSDRLAAASMMAGHPNETKPTGLRNLPFAIFMGGKDAAYDRNAKAAEWRKLLAALREADPEGYPHRVTIYPEHGHWMEREDRVALPWMASHTRDSWPRRVVWLQDDVTHDRLYWLGVPEGAAQARKEIRGRVDGQTIYVEGVGDATLRVLLRDKLIDLDRPFEVFVDGVSQFFGRASRRPEVIERSLQKRADPHQAPFAEIVIEP